MSEYEAIGVACGLCGGSVYMETCENQGGVPGHIDVTASECKQCGERVVLKDCPECGGSMSTSGEGTNDDC